MTENWKGEKTKDETLWVVVMVGKAWQEILYTRISPLIVGHVVVCTYDAEMALWHSYICYIGILSSFCQSFRPSLHSSNTPPLHYKPLLRSSYHVGPHIITAKLMLLVSREGRRSVYIHVGQMNVWDNTTLYNRSLSHYLYYRNYTLFLLSVEESVAL